LSAAIAYFHRIFISTRASARGVVSQFQVFSA